ncbi:hypothetical protein GCM10028833_31440 [Glycomyces tarimensis]
MSVESRPGERLPLVLLAAAGHASPVFPAAMTHRRVSAEATWRSPQPRPYPSARPLRRPDGEEREHRAYSIAGSSG